MSLAQLLNDKKCVPIKTKGKLVLHYYTDENNQETTPCLDFPRHRLTKDTDPVNRKAHDKYIVKWKGETAYCDDDCEWLMAE